MSSPRPFPWILALVIDAALVVLFALLGMRSHHDGFSILALATVAWPFLAGTAIGWGIARAWREPAAPLRTGLVVWLLAAGGGMVLRVATGGGFAWSFLAVTALVLAAFLIGWRALAALVRRTRRPAASR